MLLNKLATVTTIILDVDGVLTDNKLICTPEGAIWRNMHAKDGYALQSWLNAGKKMAIVTSGSDHGVLKKLEKFGVALIYSAIKNKAEMVITFAKDESVNLEKAMFIGDDIPDYEAMQLCGVACCPNDAVGEIKSICDYISPKKGGDACVRDIIEKTLRSQDKWFKPKKS